MALYSSTARPETDTALDDPTHQAVLAWLDRNRDLPVKFHDGTNWHPTPAAADRYAWYALIEATGDGKLRVSGAGPRYGSRRHTVIGEPQPLSGRLATFGEGVVFRQLLGDAVHDALAAVRHAERAATRGHRRGRRD